MESSASKLMVAGLFGLAAGIGIGILLAPDKGSKTRKRLKKKILEIAEEIKDDFPEKVNAFKSALMNNNKSEDNTTE